jgi:AcrR family transcriptional regulator
VDKETSLQSKFESLTTKGRLKVEEICRNAAEVFSSKGYINATLADVARAARMSKGGIFHYFSSKEDLLFLILCRYMDQTLTTLRAKLASDATPQDKIRIFVHHHISHYRDNFNESRLILHEHENLPSHYLEIVKSKEKEYMRILVKAIEELPGTGHKLHRRAKIAGYSLIGMCNWPYIWYDPRGPVSPEELAEEICGIFLGEYAKTPLGQEKSKRPPGRSKNARGR